MIDSSLLGKSKERLSVLEGSVNNERKIKNRSKGNESGRVLNAHSHSDQPLN
jgi:hypothetical protein